MTQGPEGAGVMDPAIKEVCSWWDKGPVKDKVSKLTGLTREQWNELIDIVAVVASVADRPPLMHHQCLGCGAEWDSRGRPQGCPLCGAPNCDLLKALKKGSDK